MWLVVVRPTAASDKANSLQGVLASIGQVLAGIDDGNGSTHISVEGSGVVVGVEGLVVTNFHVVSDEGKVYPSIFFNLLDPQRPYAAPEKSRLYRTKVILSNSDQDLVLLKIVADADGNPLDPSLTFKAVEMGDSRALGFLDEIYTVGFPKAGGTTVTIARGQISGKEELEDWIKTDAQVTHGNSGGAAVDREGRLIGIPTKVRPDIQPLDTDNDGFPDATVSFGSVGLIRPVELVSKMLEQVQKEGSAEDPTPSQVTERFEVKGLVVDGEGNSIAKALVGLLKAGSEKASIENLLTWARADENGIFQFPLNIPPGEYVIRARADGYSVHLEALQVQHENCRLLLRLDAQSAEAQP
ncbi:MAG: trypsin-like peptidase domain-containing protein [Acidobacteriota bacterium]